MRAVKLFLQALLLLILLFVEANAQWTILIDPGHGGNDHGATASDGTYEEHLNLLISYSLEDHIANDVIPDGRWPLNNIFMTRTQDNQYVSLSDRAAMAKGLAARPANARPGSRLVPVQNMGSESQPIVLLSHSIRDSSSHFFLTGGPGGRHSYSWGH